LSTRPPIQQVVSPTAVYAELETLGGGPIDSLGQNFLTDRPILSAMASDLELEPTNKVLEIGPGLGHFTECLLATGASVLAVEKDRRLAESLAQRLGSPENLDVLHADILKVDLGKIQERLLSDRFTVAGNLPYYCSSPILTRLFEAWWPHWERAGVLLQEEVVDRLVSPPGNKVYGRLSVLVQTFAEAQKRRIVKPHLFVPRPQVTSAWCVLIPKEEEGAPLDPVSVGKVTGWCFAERRKTLLNNLGRELGKPAAHTLLESAGIPPGARPEELRVDQFIRLTRVLENRQDKA
jgi:16S rRNA (adenine1518-N6/adenine1519-N6)-dimethyltransferase